MNSFRFSHINAGYLPLNLQCRQSRAERRISQGCLPPPSVDPCIYSGDPGVTGVSHRDWWVVGGGAPRTIEAFAVNSSGGRDHVAMARMCPRTMGGSCKYGADGKCRLCKRTAPPGLGGLLGKTPAGLVRYSA